MENRVERSELEESQTEKDKINAPSNPHPAEGGSDGFVSQNNRKNKTKIPVAKSNQGYVEREKPFYTKDTMELVDVAKERRFIYEQEHLATLFNLSPAQKSFLMNSQWYKEFGNGIREAERVTHISIKPEKIRLLKQPGYFTNKILVAKSIPVEVVWKSAKDMVDLEMCVHLTAGSYHKDSCEEGIKEHLESTYGCGIQILSGKENNFLAVVDEKESRDLMIKERSTDSPIGPVYIRVPGELIPYRIKVDTKLKMKNEDFTEKMRNLLMDELRDDLVDA